MNMELHNLINDIIIIIGLVLTFYVLKKGIGFENKEIKESRKLNKELEEIKENLGKKR